MKLMFKHKDNKEITIYDIEKIRPLFYISYTKYKFASLHKKSDFLYEFRVFPSKNSISALLDYTKKSIKILESSTKKYFKTPKNFLDDYFNINEEYIVDKSTIQVYEGKITSYKNYCILNFFMLMKNIFQNELRLKNRGFFENIFGGGYGLKEGEHEYENYNKFLNKYKYYNVIYEPNKDYIKITLL
jgi:hypothetical protein